MSALALARACGRVVALSVSALALTATSALAENLTLPASGTISDTGIALRVTNHGSGIGATAIAGIGTGTNGRGVVAEATGLNGIAIYGVNSRTGNAGRFVLDGANSSAASAAVVGIDSGGSAANYGDFGNAGMFEITNPLNSSAALYASSNSVGPAFQAVNSGFGYAGEFELTEGTTEAAAIYGSVTGANGNAGVFMSNSLQNTAPAVYASTYGSSGIGIKGNANNGTGVYGSGGLYGVYGTSVADTAVYGTSTTGLGGDFISGSVECYLSLNTGPMWTCSSDRNIKEDFHAVDAKEMLQRLVQMPLFSYRLKQQSDPGVRSLGPVAQDFKLAFGLGADDTHINAGNEMGVALAAIQGLYAELRDRDAKIAAQDLKIAALEQRLAQAEHAAMKSAANEDRLARLEKAMASSDRQAGDWDAHRQATQ